MDIKKIKEFNIIKFISGAVMYVAGMYVLISTQATNLIGLVFIIVAVIVIAWE